jgi:hypothetical protein
MVTTARLGQQTRHIVYAPQVISAEREEKPVGQAKASIDSAIAEEGEARTVWDIINGVTAYARSIPNSNDRVELEAKAGKLMDLVA